MSLFRIPALRTASRCSGRDDIGADRALAA